MALYHHIISVMQVKRDNDGTDTRDKTDKPRADESIVNCIIVKILFRV